MPSHPYHVDLARPWFGDRGCWPEDIPKQLELDEASLGQALRAAARRWPERQALRFLGSSLSWAGLDRCVDALAGALHLLGLLRGDTVALLLPPSAQIVVGYFAVLRLGAVVTVIDPEAEPEPLLEQLEVTRARALLCLDALYHERVAPVIDRSHVEAVVVTNLADLTTLGPLQRFIGHLRGRIPTGPCPPTVHPLEELLKRGEPPPPVTLEPTSAPAMVQMTTGSSGRPKAALLTHVNLLANATQLSRWLPELGPGARVLGALPFHLSFSVTSVLNLCVVTGAWAHLIPEGPHDTKAVLATIQDGDAEGATLLPARSEMLERLVEDSGDREQEIAGNLSVVVSALEPIDGPLRRRVEEQTGADVVETYGLAEASPVVSAGLRRGLATEGTVGVPLPGTDVSLVDRDSGAVIEPEEVDRPGEVLVSGPQVMRGYLGQELERAITFERGRRWLRTGDIGVWKPGGLVALSERR